MIGMKKTLDLSSISNTSLFGRYLRFPLNCLPHSAVVRVLQGRLRGYRWVVGSGQHGFWLGSYELPKQRRLVTAISVGNVVYDIGANVGFYTLLASECVGPSGHVHAFEPLPENIEFLERHVRLNQRSNISIHPVAVSVSAGRLRFARSHNRYSSHIDQQGELEVNSISLDEFIYVSGNPVPNLMKVDIEGAEFDLLCGARRLLESSPPLIFLATHGFKAHAACCELLYSASYNLESLTNEPVETTSELLCFPPTRKCYA